MEFRDCQDREFTSSTAFRDSRTAVQATVKRRLSRESYMSKFAWGRSTCGDLVGIGVPCGPSPNSDRATCTDAPRKVTRMGPLSNGIWQRFGDALGTRLPWILRFPLTHRREVTRIGRLSKGIWRALSGPRSNDVRGGGFGSVGS
jgi:hypothetical protein